MTTSTIHLLTVVAEGVLEDRLVRDLVAVGATGWTTTACRGHGSGGADAGEFEGGNVRVEVLLPQDRLPAAWSVLEERYLGIYSVVAWAHPVQVARSGKYGA